MSERDADVEPLDREEVEELHERDAEDTEQQQTDELAPVGPQRSPAGSPGRSASSPTSAPVQRTSVSRSDDRPDSRITFETIPLSANSVPAENAIA